MAWGWEVRSVVRLGMLWHAVRRHVLLSSACGPHRCVETTPPGTSHVVSPVSSFQKYSSPSPSGTATPAKAPWYVFVIDGYGMACYARRPLRARDYQREGRGNATNMNMKMAYT